VNKMPQIINTNIASLNAQRNLDKSQSANQQSLQRLSSGLRINSAKDDAAGLAISTRFTSQIKGMNVAVRNAGDGIALAQTAEGALGSMNDSLQRIRELSVQSANATNSDVDREALQAEVGQLVAEISRTADDTDFNGRKLLDGSFSASFQVGANAGQTIDVSIAELTTDKLGSSNQSGVSAIGTDASLANGDLTINGVAVQASRAEDDTASTANKAASAISKVEAINRVSDQSGVTAQVNENTVAGSAMTGTAGSGSFDLNGVSVSFTTSTDTAQTRAAVAQAINAVSAQTGVTAVAGETEKDGVSLVAEDGRNITLELDTADLTTLTGDNFSAATGLAGAESLVSGSTTEFSDTFEGGYTLIADGGQKSINIEGGNGTGRGDLANAGLVAGDYSVATAAVVSEKTTGAAVGVAMELGGTIANGISTSGDSEFSAPVDVAVTIGGSDYVATAASGGTIADIATSINTVVPSDEAVAYEEIEVNIDFTAGASGTFTIAGVDLGAADGDTNAMLVDKINSVDFSAADIEVTASLNDDGTVDAVIKNFSATAVVIASTDAAMTADVTIGSTVDFDLDNDTATLSGDLMIMSTGGEDVTTKVSTTVAAQAELFSTSTNVQSVESSSINVLEAGDLTINGTGIGAALTSSDTASATQASNGDNIISSDKGRSAISVAAAINDASDATGVSASVNATQVVGGDGSNADKENYAIGDSADIFINGVNLGTVTLQDDGAAAIDLDKARSDTLAFINSKASQTGVTAVDNGVSITLSAADGRNVSVAIDNNAASGTGDDNIGSLLGLDSSVEGIGEAKFAEVEAARGLAGEANAEALVYETTYGTVKLESAKEITVGAGSESADEVEALGLKLGTYGGGEDGQFLKDIDISTAEGATAALTAIDNAIGQVATQRADLGAVQNRMESAVSNLQVTSENLNAANSRIQDADFAAETAEMQRTNVLQQAGISILAQANASGQQVLSLLG
ncbi:MAG: flagellin, partial [Oleispira sp.]